MSLSSIVIMCRMKSHSTSDEQGRYQDMEEVQQWKEKNCPVHRLGGYLQTKGLWEQVMTLSAVHALCVALCMDDP